MKDKGLILIVALLFSLGVVSGMIVQQHKVIEVNNINKAYKEEIGKRLDEIKKVKMENNNFRVILGAQTEVMKKAIKEIELRIKKLSKTHLIKTHENYIDVNLFFNSSLARINNYKHIEDKIRRKNKPSTNLN